MHGEEQEGQQQGVWQAPLQRKRHQPQVDGGGEVGEAVLLRHSRQFAEIARPQVARCAVDAAHAEHPAGTSIRQHYVAACRGWRQHPAAAAAEQALLLLLLRACSVTVRPTRWHDGEWARLLRVLGDG